MKGCANRSTAPADSLFGSPLLSKPHAKSCVPPQVAIRVPALGLREIRMADKVVRLNVRAFIHNARQAPVWKIALPDICKAIEQLDDQITDLASHSKKLTLNPQVKPN